MSKPSTRRRGRRRASTQLHSPPASDLGSRAPVGLGVSTLDGRIVAANDALASQLGVDAGASLEGALVTDFHASPDSMVDIVRERLADGTLEGVEVELVRADGSLVTVRVSACIDEVDGARVVRFSSERVRRDGASASGYGYKMEAVERVAAGVAHDYNNILTTIVGEAGQLLHDLPSTEAAHASAGAILHAAERAAAITRKLVVFSRAGQTSPEVVDLNRRIEAMRPELHALTGEGVSLVTRLDPMVGTAWIDPVHLRVVLHNLVSNAAEAMPGGGRIVVETSVCEAPTDTDGIDFHPPVPDGRYVSLVVGDDGEGMSPEARRSAFDPFFTTKPRGEGAGLGLATVQGLILRASGHVALLSAVGWGTLVRILLPLHDSPPAHLPETAVAHAANRPRSTAPKILVVDDEGSVLRVMIKILRRAGYTAISARDAFEAQDKIRRIGAGLDLVVTDVMMPRRTGTQLARWLHERHPGIPILLVSGYADDTLTHEWVESDPEVLLAKPFTPEELLWRVAQRIG